MPTLTDGELIVYLFVIGVLLIVGLVVMMHKVGK